MVVVMDDLGAHKVKGVREKIEAAGARLLSLSPCRPDFNPSEAAWSKLKTSLRKAAARPTEALDKAIGGGRRAVSATDARAATSLIVATIEAYPIKKRSNCKEKVPTGRGRFYKFRQTRHL